MRLHVIGTGSSGNAYLLADKENSEALLLDAGVKASRITEAIFQTKANVVGCLVTHEHKDHCIAVADMDKLGIECYGTKLTAQAVGNMHVIRPYDPTIGSAFQDVKPFGDSFLVMAFRTNHDAVDPCGFLITNVRTGERMIYATDTYYLAYRFPGIHYWLIECNYCEDMLVAEDTPHQLARRLNLSHMSMNRLCQMFQANDLSTCRKIILCHLSHDRGDENRMTEAIRQVTHKPVSVAKPGLAFDLNLKPF